ncbi:MAG: hypothetical protein QUS08_10500, partial [Methanothrix sp.]|nr:hypothetical protein [Methanothrix sp.]
AAVRLQRIDRLALAWTAGVMAIVILADMGPLGFVGTADRLMLGLYLPLSLLSGAALSRMEGSDGRIGRMFLLLLTLVGAASMGVVLYSYAGSWGLPAEDYEAIIWLKDLNLSDAVCINLDETGAWVYPVAGIRASMPRGIPTGFAYGLPGRIALDPGDPAVLEELKGLAHRNVLIYISSVSITRPGHIPPFAEYSSVYPAVNLSYPQGSYELLYDRGARIYRFQVGLERSDPLGP